MRISLHEAWQNYREYDASWATKLRMAAANQLMKIRTGQPCCGHPGEPGC